VFSNAALHWMKRSAEVADRISRALRPRGRFVAEFGGKGNLDAIHGSIHQAMQALGCPAGEDLNLLYFPTVGEYASLLEARRLAVTYASLFDRPTPLEGGDDGLRHWIEMFARDFLARLAPPQQQQLITMVENQLRPTLFRDGTWFADYRRIRVIAVRE
jgi:trans-aconitate methyltransferase